MICMCVCRISTMVGSSSSKRKTNAAGPTNKNTNIVMDTSKNLTRTGRAHF